MSDVHDLLVIGGGINGCGIARDAVLRGLDTVLVERRDIASGTSADSTKLIHGGLRYLEYYEFGLVSESLRERERLLHLAPHLVRPMRFTIPIYTGGPYPRWKIGAGLALYELMTGLRTRLPRAEMHSTADLKSMVPAIALDGLTGGFSYSDAQVPYPERLCLENALDAESLGAKILTRHEATGFIVDDRRVAGVVVTDTETGDRREIRARTTINAAGPWVDLVLALIAGRIAGKMGGTRGMHLLMPRRPGGPREALYTPAHSDGRPFFVVPWRDWYWVGTTDIPHSDPDTAVPTVSERDYLLGELDWLLPDLRYTADDVIYAQSGVRPLPEHDRAKPGAITRRHMVFDHAATDGIEGLFSIIGGKLTTYRQLAEEAVDAVFHSRGIDAPPMGTRDRVLPGAGPFLGARRVSPELSAHLASLYGSRAEGVVALAECSPALAEKLDPALPDIAAEVVWAVRHEMARHVDDVLLRRTGIGTGATEGFGALDRVAHLMGAELGWSDDIRMKEIAAYRDLISREHRVHLATPSHIEV